VSGEVGIGPGCVNADRRQGAVEILVRAQALRVDMDRDPDLAADPMVAGEVEGLWAAMRIADADLWQTEHDKDKKAERG
jgi:hypothetical protein